MNIFVIKRRRQEYCTEMRLVYNAYCGELVSFSQNISTFEGSFFLKCSALTISSQVKTLFVKEGAAAYLRGKLLFFEDYHLFRALLAGHVARVQDFKDEIDYIFLLCCVLRGATQATSLVDLTVHVLPQSANITSAVTDYTMAGHWCDTTWL